MSMSPARLWRNRIPRYRIVGIRCEDCGRAHYPPRPACPYCGSRNVKTEEMPKRGKVLSFSITYSVPEGFRARSPLVIATVELENGVKVVAPLTDVDPSQVSTGMPVEAVIRRIRESGRYGLIGYGLSFRPLRFGS